GCEYWVAKHGREVVAASRGVAEEVGGPGEVDGEAEDRVGAGDCERAAVGEPGAVRRAAEGRPHERREIAFGVERSRESQERQREQPLREPQSSPPCLGSPPSASVLRLSEESRYPSVCVVPVRRGPFDYRGCGLPRRGAPPRAAPPADPPTVPAGRRLWRLPRRSRAVPAVPVHRVALPDLAHVAGVELAARGLLRPRHAPLHRLAEADDLIVEVAAE